MAAARAWHAFAADVGGWELLGFGAWAIEEKATGDFAGQLSLNKPPHFPEREIGWFLLAGLRGPRLSPPRPPRAARALRLRHPRPGNRSSATSIPANARSIRLAERLGARLDPAAPQPAAIPMTSSTATPARRRCHDRSADPAHRAADAPPAPAERLGAHFAAFFASDASRYVGGPLPRQRSWHGFAADVGSWMLLGFGCWACRGDSHRRLRRPGRPRPARALPRAPRSAGSSSPSSSAAATPRGGAAPAPSPTAPSAGPPPSATSTPTTPPRSPSRASLGCVEDPGRRVWTRSTSSSATLPPEAA